jgi:glycosyltransferase involved in cell wall biosynthesis
VPLPRVAVLCAISGLGGAEISLLELVTRLRDSYEFHLIVPGEGLFKRNAELAGAKTWVLSWPEALATTGETAARPGPAQLFRAVACLRAFARRLSELIEEIGPSALVTNAAKAHVMGALIRKPKHVPLIWYMRDGLEDRVLSRKLLALLSRRCDLAVCISQYVAEQFRRYVSAAVPTNVVYNIVDLERFHPYANRDQAGHLQPEFEDRKPADLDKKPGEVWYGMVGAITPLKGHDIFLDAAEKVLGGLPNAVFVIVGDNPYATEASLNYQRALEHKVESSSLRGRVRFLGFREDVPGILSLLDVLVQPNRGPEGLGRSVLEALACGVPVVAVNQWGPAELICDGHTGLLFPPLDIEMLAARMIELGRDGSLRKSMGNHGRGWIQENLVPEDLAKQFAGILTSTIRPRLQEAMA